MNIRRAAIAGASPAVRRSARAARQPGPPWFRAHWVAIATAAAGAIGGVAMQAFSLITWGSALNQRVGDLERASAQLAGVPASLATLDERSRAQGAQLDHLVAVQDRTELRRRARDPVIIDPPPIDANAVRPEE